MLFDTFIAGSANADEYALSYPRSFDTKASNPGRYNDMNNWAESVLQFTPRDNALSDREMDVNTVPAAGVTGASRPAAVPTYAVKSPFLHKITSAVGSVVEGVQVSVVKQQTPGIGGALSSAASVKLLGSKMPYIAALSNTATGLEAEKASEQVVGQVHDAVRAQQAPHTATLQQLPHHMYSRHLNAVNLELGGSWRMRDILPQVHGSLSQAQRKASQQYSEFAALDNTIRGAIDGTVNAKLYILPDYTIGLNLGYVTSAVSACLEARNGKSPFVGSLFEARLARLTIGSFTGHSVNSKLVTLLQRAYNSEKVKVDGGFEVFVNKGEPANGAFGARITTKLAQDRLWQLVFLSSLMQLSAYSTAELSRRHGVVASAMLQHNWPDASSRLAVGAVYSPPKEALPQLNGEYTLQARVDSRTGAAIQVTKRNLFSLPWLTGRFDVSSRSPINVLGKDSASAAQVEHKPFANDLQSLGSVRFGISLTIDQ